LARRGEILLHLRGGRGRRPAPPTRRQPLRAQRAWDGGSRSRAGPRNFDSAFIRASGCARIYDPHQHRRTSSFCCTDGCGSIFSTEPSNGWLGIRRPYIRDRGLQTGIDLPDAVSSTCGAHLDRCRGSIRSEWYPRPVGRRGKNHGAQLDVLRDDRARRRGENAAYRSYGFSRAFSRSALGGTTPHSIGVAQLQRSRYSRLECSACAGNNGRAGEMRLRVARCALRHDEVGVSRDRLLRGSARLDGSDGSQPFTS